jgi:hypothetical protein
MPKLGGMAQLSRPFQIALVAVCLLAAVWLFALQGHSSSPTSSASSSVAATSTSASKPSNVAAAEAKSAAAPSTVYHGSAPGVEGLTRAIAKAHGAVAASQQNAKRLEAASARASGESASSSSTPASSTPASSSSKPASSASTPASATHASSAPHPSVHVAPTTSARTTIKPQPIKAQAGAGRIPARQALVEHALSEGKIAVILFWNPKGADDVAVDQELRVLEAIHHLIRPVAHVPQVRSALERSGLELQKPFAAFQSNANQVATYGSITRGVQVYATPTILIVNKAGKTIVLTGLQDAFSIEQAIDEARNS